MENLQTLKKSLLFAGLSEENMLRIAEISHRRTFQKGETIFAEGDAAIGFYLLAKGGVKLCKISPDGREKVLHFVHPGETFAEAAFFGDGRYPAEARGVEQGELLMFPRDGFMGLLEQDARFSLNLIVSLSMSLRRFARQIEELSFAEVPNRLAAYLLEIAGRKSTNYQGRVYIDLEMKKGELASRLGTVSETLSRAFRKLKEDGLLEVEGGRVIILNEPQLRIIASSGGRMP